MEDYHLKPTDPNLEDLKQIADNMRHLQEELRAQTVSVNQVPANIDVTFRQLLSDLNIARQALTSGDKARYFAVTITEVEKAYAYFRLFIIDR